MIARREARRSTTSAARAAGAAVAALAFAVSGCGGPRYAFSLSASATDPHVNHDTPTGEPRPLYFWVTCDHAGIAACEGWIHSDLPVLGFTPSPGFLNIGSGNRFQMAIPDCPTDTTIVLGHWEVWDTGGSVSLGDSPDGDLSAVDCAPSPNLTTRVRVTGFSSADD